jgi:molecular chaperone DnaK
MVQEAEQMREADSKKKEGVQAKNDAESLCHQVEKQLSELKEKMTTDDANDLKKKMEDVRTAIAEDIDPEEIKNKTKELQDASWKVTQQAYQQGSDSSSSSEAADDKDKKEESESKFEEKEKDSKEEKEKK